MVISSSCNMFSSNRLFAGMKNKDLIRLGRRNMRMTTLNCYQNQSNVAPLRFDFTIEENKREFVTKEKMDEWIKNSIGEIVKNIEEAPFLVQIFSQGPSILKLEKQQESSKTWPLIKNTWNKNTSIPKGIILVEELDKQAEEDDMNKTWGLLIQGHAMDCAASCYILNTCTVTYEAGVCTHFCLASAKCSGESLDKQFEKAWLIQR